MCDADKKAIRILLITNCNSDNLGDRLIEICDISLIRTVMKNLGKEDYSIKSVNSGFISKKESKNMVKDTDLIIFGGAPVFNYAYQNFYSNTIKTIETAELYGKPVIFSAVGIESYDENSVECQKLKKAVNKDCVKQITTRDGFNFLEKYHTNPQIPIAKVADPATFTGEIFNSFIKSKHDNKKKIGIFILREAGFKDNNINFSGEKAATLWKGVEEELKARGYDYEFLSSGHFPDEAFIEKMINKYGINPDKCVFNMDAPEKMVSRISSYDGVISCRLHPSITSYSLEVPSVGIVWNNKVVNFYNNIGYPERLIRTDRIKAKHVVNTLILAMKKKVKRDNEYRMTVYQTLFEGIRCALQLGNDSITAYNYDEFLANLCLYEGTSELEREEYMKRKFHRIYSKYNRLTAGYRVIYNSGMKSDRFILKYDNTKGKIKYLETGTVEYQAEEMKVNNGKSKFHKNGFSHPGYQFAGWVIRIKKDNGKWFWYAEDGSLIPKDIYVDATSVDKKVFADKATIPYISIGAFELIVAEAVWRKLQ